MGIPIVFLSYIWGWYPIPSMGFLYIHLHNGEEHLSPQSSDINLCEVYPPQKQQFAPENGWLEDKFPFGMAYFQVRKCSF